MPIAPDNSPPKKVIVCIGRACCKYNAERVLANLQADSLPGVEIIPIRCLGQCGNGPMLLIQPEEIWYWQVHPDEVAVIITQHLQAGKPIKQMLYPKFHQDS